MKSATNKEISTSTRTLVVPCAGRSRRYPGMRPKWLLTHPDGELMIEKAIAGINTQIFNRIIITIVREHADKFEAEVILKKLFPNPKFEILILDEFTQSASETVYRTLKDKEVKGAFVVKDSDNYVSFDLPDEFDNFVVGLNLNTFGDVSNITGKSFILINEQDILIDIIEKSVRSHLICLGVYAFEDATIFTRAYERLSSRASVSGELFISHVISYLIGHDNAVFRYSEAKAFEDWGTLRDWRAMQTRFQTYFVDLDGILLKNSGRYGKINWDNNQETLPGNFATLQELQNAGAQIVIVTSRPEQYRSMVERILREQGIRWHQIVMGCNHSRRVLINDFAPSNPYPSCVAVNVPRDGAIKDYLGD